MNQIDELAQLYARYWNRDTSGNWQIADNAPNPLWKFALRGGYDRQMLYTALTSVATNRPPETPSLPKMLEWFAANPDCLESCDEVLRGYKQVPKTFEEVVQKAYKKQLFAIVSDLHQHLTHEISRY